MRELEKWADRVLADIQGWTRTGVAKTIGSVLQTAERLADTMLREARKPGETDDAGNTPPGGMRLARVQQLAKTLDNLGRSAQTYAEIYQWAEVKQNDYQDDDPGLLDRLPSVLSVPEVRQLQQWVDRLRQSESPDTSPRV